MVRYSFFLFDSFIHYSTPVYPDAIQANNLPHKKPSQRAKKQMDRSTKGSMRQALLQEIEHFRDCV
jgi:hypothetical protein